MGNWMTVTIMGTVPGDEVEPLREACLIDWEAEQDNRLPPEEWKEWGPLCFTRKGSLFGLGMWPRATVAACGNCFERDYSPEDVADQLRKLLAAAPGMKLKVHCGGDWESEDCVATVSVENGQVTVGPPEVTKVSGVTPEEGASRLARFMMGG